MNYKCPLSFILFISTMSVFANPTLDRIKANNPEAYAEAKLECESWAESDMIDSQDKPDYMRKCLDDSIGYLDQAIEDNDYEVSPEDESEQLFE